MMNTRKKSQTKPSNAPSGLDLVGLDSLGDLLKKPTANGAEKGFMELELDLIDEDPHQPRTESNPGYTLAGIEELGTTIKSRGVKSPISVRVNPDDPDRYLINHGARRFRASKWAGRTTIPAFIDNDYNETDQVIENLQRENLTAREIADFIGRELSKGRRAVEIAQAIGKSKAFVSQHTALLDLPDPIAEVFNEGRTKDVTTINELLRVYKKSPSEVQEWLNDPDQVITRETVSDLKDFIEEKRIHAKAEDPASVDQHERPQPGQLGQETGIDEGADTGSEPTVSYKEAAKPDPARLRKSLLIVRHDGRRARLILMRRPSTEGRAWLKYDDDGSEVDADLENVKLITVIEG